MQSRALRIRAILRVLGVIIGVTSLSKLPSTVLAWWLGEPEFDVFFGSFLLSAMLGVLVWWPHRNIEYDLRLRDGFLIVTLTWVLASLVSTLPLMYAPPHLSFTNAMFEAMSGLTTTGSTVISGLDQLPKSVLLFRTVLQFLGGMGIVILAVAILPMLKIGGTQLFRAETTGPARDNKLTPRIAETAKALWLVYVGLIGLSTFAFWVAGMNLFDALSHAVTTVSTGGFSNYDAGFDHWQKPLLEVIAIVFMILGGANFGLHFVAWRRASLAVYFGDSELKAFLRILLAASLLVALILRFSGDIAHIDEALLKASFMVVSMMTTTGFAVSGFDQWSGVAPLVLMVVAVIGGCSGSTSGGMKVARVLMVVRQGLREVRQLIHPKGQFLVKMSGRRVSESVVLSVSGFITLWILCFMAVMAGMNAFGLDLLSAFGGTVATMANAGPGLGSVAYTFANASPGAVWMGTLGMLLGRLEVFSVLVLLTPQFWRE